MNKKLTDVSSYVKTVNYVDVSIVLGTTGCNDESFIEYLNNESYAFGTNALTLATKEQVTNTLQRYNDTLLTPKVWVINALLALHKLLPSTYINLED